MLAKFKATNAGHKDMLAVLAAVTEVIKQEGGKETETEYFAALMTTLEVTPLLLFTPPLSPPTPFLISVSYTHLPLPTKRIV